ncbi:MAG: choice-of-anchor D domain-containing protein, partial [Calditrichaeota bacterium]|nr:choice-of-anchor D domain-containing protein [Calditrichota bacterium]
MLRTNPFLLLLFCVLFASPLFAEVVVDPNGFELQEVPTGTSSIEIMTLSNLGDNEVDISINVEVGEEFMAPDRDQRGDPDDMGYEWRDNLEDDGPEFEWVDIRELEGTNEFRLGDDQNTGALQLGWTYTFWGREFQTVFANSDAWASFTYSGNGYNIAPNDYPLAANGNVRNANFINMMQIDNTQGTEVWFWTNENDEARIMWSGNHNTWFELALHGNGLAVMQYGEGVGQRNCGVNLGDGDHGWYFGNQIEPGRAIAFGPPGAWVSWIAVDPPEGSIASGDEFEVDVIFNTEGIEDGDYSASIFIETSEGEHLEVAVDMNVVGGPAIFSEIQEWDFGDVYVGIEADAAIPVENIGQEDLIIDEITCNNPDVFYAEDAPDGGWVIAPGEVLEVIIHVTPAAQGNDEGVLVVNSNALNFPEVPFELAVNGLVQPAIFVDPMGIEVDLNTGESTEQSVNIANEGGSELIVEIEHVIISEPDRDQNDRHVRQTNNQAGPRRDEVDLDGMMFASFQDNSNWGWLDDGMRQDPLLNNDNLISFRNGASWAEEDFEDYNAIVMSTYSQNFNNQYNANFERFCEYIDGGGALYAEMGDANRGVRTPGGIMNDQNLNSANGFLTVSPDPGDDNYSLFAEICQESQPDFWNVDERIEGNSWLHSGFQLAQFNEGVDNGTLEYYQVIAVHENDRNVPGAIVYGYGGGTVLVTGHPVGHCWFNYNEEGMWGSIGAEILYFLSQAGSAKWLAYEPTEMVLQPDEDSDVIITLDATGLYTGEYEADLHILSNDPEDSDVAVGILINCQGAPDMVAAWDEALGFPNVIDWNAAYEDLYTGNPYTITVTISNEGTEPLLIEDYISNHNYFTTDFEQEFEIPIGETVEMVLTFAAPAEEPNDYNAIVTIISDDPDEPEFEIALHATASLPPTIAVDPIGVEADLMTGEIREFPINVANDGDAPLRGTIEAVSIDEPEVDAAGRSVRSISLERVANRDRRGEVDDEGYEWRDNLEDDGPEYEWIDILEFEGVRQFALGDDQLTPQIDFGWNFEFYGREHNHYWACSDGWMSWTRAQYARSVPTFPMADQNWFNTVLWADGDWHGQNNGVFTWDNGRDLAICTWHQNSSRMGGPLADIQIIWNGDGMIKIQYGRDFGNGNGYDNGHYGSEVGVMGNDAQHGFQIVAPGDGAGYLVEGRAIALGPQSAWTRWISVDVDEFELNPGDDIEVMLTLNAEGLIGGEYEGSVNFDSNDPEDPHVEVGVLLTVTGAPDITVEWPEEIGFPNVVNWNDAYLDVFSGGPYPIPVTISNFGTEVLIVSDVSSDHEYFGSDVDGDVEIPIGESVDVSFIFNGAEPGNYDAVMVITSDDPDMEFLEIALHAEATLPPQMAIDPMEIAEDMVTGESIEPVITISNDGDAILRWDSEFEVLSEPEVDSGERNVRSIDGQFGPRRDEVDLDGMTFASFQDNGNWGWLDDGMRQDPLLNDENFISFRNAASWAEENFEDYDAIVMSTYGQRFVNEYNANFDRFCEYIDGGGALYAEMGDANQGVRTPGGIMNDWGINSTNGFLTVSPDPGDDNYSLFAEICQESQPDFWNVDERIEGNSWLHSGFQLAQFDNGVEEEILDYYQVIAVHENDRNAPGAIVYGYGGGTVMVTGHPVGHCWFNYNQEGMWGSIGAEILYFLTQAGSAQWFSYEPDAGEIPSGEEDEIFAVISAEGLVTGAYIGELTIFSNDPGNQIAVVSVEINVEGAADIDPVWSEEAGYAEAIDWNEVNEDLFTGVAYTIPVALNNEGTDLLIVSDFVSDNDYFMVPFDEDIEVEVNEAVVVDFIFEAPEDDPGDFNATMTIVSNDPDEAEFVINLHAAAGLPPEIFVDRMEYEADMAEASSEEFIMNVANEGGSLLRFATAFEVLSEPGQDDVGRSVRSIAAGPVDSDRNPVFDEPNELSVLLLKAAQNNGFGWANNNTWLEVFNNQDQEPVLEDIQNIGNINLSDYDLVVTGEDQNGALFQTYNQNREAFDEYVDGGGIFCFFTGSNSFQDVSLPSNDGDVPVARGPNGDWGDVNAEFLNEEGDGLIEGIEEEFPILTPFEFFRDDQGSQDRIRTRMRGNSLNYSIVNHADLPEDAVWYYRPEQQENTTIIADWPYGSGYVLYTGITGTLFYQQNWQWSSMMECVNLTRWADGVSNVRWFTWEPTEDVLEPDEDIDVIATVNTEGLLDGDYEGMLTYTSNDPATPIVEVMFTITVQGMSHLTGDPIPEPLEGALGIEFDDTYADGSEAEFVVTLINLGSLDATVNQVEITGANAGDFSTDIDDELVVAAREEADVVFTFTPENAGVCEATIILHTDAMNLEDGDIWWEVSGLGQLPPVLIVDPEELMAGMLIDDEPIDQMLLIGNDEGDFRRDLEFEISIEDVEEERDEVNRSVRSISPDRLVNRDNRGDADDMGWEWRDNLEDDGPEFEWVDVRELEGVRTFNMGDDQNTGALQLGWTYTFWGREFQTIYANTDAWASFTYTGNGYNISPAGYPLAANGNARNANFINFMQVDHTQGTDVWFWTNEQDQARIMWAGNHATWFELELNANGLAVMQYSEGNQPRNCGVNLGDGDHGWFFGNQIADGRAIAFGPAGAWSTWVTAEPMEGTVVAGEFAEVTVTFDASELEDMSEYNAILTVASNDPENPEVIVPVTLLTGQREEVQELVLDQGWNMVSLRVDPVEFYVDDAPGPDVELMFEQLEDEEGNQPIQLL